MRAPHTRTRTTHKHTRTHKPRDAHEKHADESVLFHEVNHPLHHAVEQAGRRARFSRELLELLVLLTCSGVGVAEGVPVVRARAPVCVCVDVSWVGSVMGESEARNEKWQKERPFNSKKRKPPASPLNAAETHRHTPVSVLAPTHAQAHTNDQDHPPAAHTHGGISPNAVPMPQRMQGR